MDFHLKLNLELHLVNEGGASGLATKRVYIFQNYSKLCWEKEVKIFCKYFEKYLDIFTFANDTIIVPRENNTCVLLLAVWKAFHLIYSGYKYFLSV